MKDLEYSIIEKYLEIKETVIANGYEYEIEWQEDIKIQDINENAFLKEYVWVILSSGFKERVVRRIFKDISEIFNSWSEISYLNTIKDNCKDAALRVFNNKSKIDSICEMIDYIDKNGFEELEYNIYKSNVDFFYKFKYIGPITVIHLFKNLGISVVKPDRHLIKISNALGVNSPNDLCNLVAQFTGDDLKVIDLILWRWATIVPNYINLLKK